MMKQAELATQSGLLALVLNASFYGVSTFRGAHWQLTKEECLQASNTLTLAINSSFPENYLAVYNETLSRYAPWVAVVTSFGAIISKRVAADRIIAAQATGGGIGAHYSGGNGGVSSEAVPSVPSQSAHQFGSNAEVGGNA